MLTFTTTEDYLLICGKTAYIKDVLKCLGGKWKKNTSCWAIPIFLDSDILREAMLGDVITAYKLRHTTRRNRDIAL
jgi:hypothetical protein